jgi:putative tryptophan/tyrosine transport system substrate-binding protein
VFLGPPGTPDTPDTQLRLGAFRKELEARGWIEGRNIRIEYRALDPDDERRAANAAQLVGLAPDVILSGPPGLKPLQRLTRTIPVVFVVVLDPVGEALVASLAHPGGNMTGFAVFDPEITPKYMQLLKGIAPGIGRVAMIYDPRTPGIEKFAVALVAAAPSFGVQTVDVPVRNAAEIEQRVTALAGEPRTGFIAAANIFRDLDLFLALTARYRLPTISFFPSFARAGGVMSYGVDDVEQFRGAATYVDRILKGERPGELPIQYPTKYTLTVNLKAAKAIGLTIPETLLATADEVIQ